MRIDSHQHFWKYNPVRDSWIDNTMGAIRKNFLPKDLAPILKENNIEGTIAVQADQSLEETNFLLQLAKENDFIKGVVGWVDLTGDNIEEQLSQYSKYSKFKGVRHILQAEHTDFILQKDFQYGISKLSKFNLTYDVLILPHQLKNTIDLIEKFPEQKFVLNHLGKPNIKDKKIQDWKSEISVLSSLDNVSCKLSGMVTETHWKEWTISEFTAYLDVIFNAFGVDRVMYGSDWPVCLLSAKYEEQLTIIETYISEFSEEEKLKIMGKNVFRFYNL